MRYTFILTFLFSSLILTAQDFDKAKFDQYLTELGSNNKAMLSLAIRKDGELTYQKSIGYADVASQQAANAETQYRIGSITKVFTTVMVFQLIEEGKLSLETNLSDYYPKVKNADKITISMLLSHRSGIHNFTNDLAYQAYMTDTKSKNEMIEIIEALGSDFEPGSKADYSNSAFVLLGFIIEDITKDSYANQLQSRIAKKLGLSRTAYGSNISVADNQANSYKPGDQSWIPATITDMSIPHGAGAIISTPADVSEFLTALFAGKLISQANLDLMKDIREGYGRGLFRMPFYGKTGYGHSGGIDSFSSNSAYFREDGVALAVTANGLDMPLNDILLGALSIYFGREYDIPDFSEVPVKLPVETLKQYEGTYASEGMPLKITLKEVDGALTAQATGQPAFPLSAYSEYDFRFSQARIVVLFNKEDPKQFTMTQNGRSFQFKRE